MFGYSCALGGDPLATASGSVSEERFNARVAKVVAKNAKRFSFAKTLRDLLASFALTSDRSITTHLKKQ